MSIQIRTDRYVFAHARKPKGRGSWAFIREASHGLPAAFHFAPANLTYAEACAWVRVQARREGFQDATIHAAP